jgi:hypothetical protein
MAELIPLEYRVRVATRQRARLWAFVCGLAVAVAALPLSYSFAALHSTSVHVADLESQYQSRSLLTAKAEDVKAKRLAIADHMRKIQQLMDDHILLSLLQQMSSGFSGNDCLEYIHIDARGTPPSNKDGTVDMDAPPNYVVRLNGVTSNTQTLAELMARLSTPGQMPVSVMLDKSYRDTLLDGQAVKFQITCEKSKSPANDAG